MKLKLTLLITMIGLYVAGQSDKPCSAPTLPVNTSCTYTSGTTIGANQQTNPNNGGTPSCSSIGEDVWYSFTAPATGGVTITTQAGGITDGGMALYSGPCGSSMVELACDDDGGAGFMPLIQSGGLTPGEIYFVRFWDYGGGTGTFDICVTEYTPPLPATNDDCSNAINVPVSPFGGACTTVSGTVMGATTSSQTNDCSGTADDDVWFSFTASATSAEINLTNVNGSVTDMYFSVYNGNCGAPGTALLCSDSDAGIVTGLTPGNTYFVRVYTWTSTGGQNSTFDLCIQDPPPPPSNDDCSNAIAVTMTSFGTCNATTGTVAGGTPSGTATGCLDTPTDDVWYSFTATDDSAYVHTNVTFDADVEILSSCTSSIGCNLFYATNGVTLVTGLTPGSTYFVRIFSEDPSFNTTSDFTLCVTGPPPAPTNDDCSNATTVTMGTTCNAVSGNVLGATQSGSTACSGTNDDDVWYSFVATDDSAFVSRTANFDSYLEVLDGCSGTSLLCTDAEGSILVDGLTIGNTYYYRIYSWSSTPPADGSFTTCVIEPGSTPDNVSCPSMEPICSDSPIAFMAETGGEDAETVDPNNNYDCLSTSPNPTWYYLQIANSGALSIDITGSDDVDYAIWGPYTSVPDAQSNCNAYPLPKDCSYSSSAIEQVNIASVLAGETYVLLVTNYADVPQMINLSSSPSNTATTDCAIVTLPIELKEFVVKQSGLNVQLNWTTASEQNNDYFEVQKTKDGKSWKTIATIDGAGTSNVINQYKDVDLHPYNGISYYRLKQVDFNGDYKFSPIKKVNFRGDDNIKIYPQPANDVVKIEWSGFNGNVALIDFSGKSVEVSIQKNGIGNYSIDVSHLSQGIYFVKLYDGATTTIKKLLVQ